MFVRTASARDLDEVRRLLVETWHATYDPIYGPEQVSAITDEWHSMEALRARLDMTDGEFVLADDGEAIAGMAFARAMEEGSVVMLHQLYVRPGYQGRGVGGLLLEEVEDSFPEARTIRLEVEEANRRAVSFYEGYGFEMAGRTDNCGCAGSGIPAMIMEKPVARP